MTVTTYTFETASPGWTEQNNNFGIPTAHNTASTICSQQGYFNNSPVLFGGTYYNESVIQSDAALDADSIKVYFNAVNGTYSGGYLNQVTIKYANNPAGPWTGGGSFTFGSVTNFGADGCQSLTFTPGSGVTGKYFRIYVNVNGATSGVQSYIYKLEFTTAAPASGLRYLDLAANFTNLFATALDTGTLKLFKYDHATLTETELETFGSCTTTDIDNGTNALNVSVNPVNLNRVYVWGYDGNGVQLWYSSFQGSSFVDISGSWGSNVIVGLEFNFFEVDDMIVFLNNDDIYYTTDNGATWTKIADGPGANITHAERSPIIPDAFIVSSSTNGDLDLSINLGVDFRDISISTGASAITGIKKGL